MVDPPLDDRSPARDLMNTGQADEIGVAGDAESLAVEVDVVAGIAALFERARGTADAAQLPLSASNSTFQGFGAEFAPESDDASTRASAPLFEFGPLRVVERVAGGAYGEVYRAWDPTLAREVALKLLREDVAASPAAVQAVLREGKLLARVRNRHVMVVHGALHRDGRVGLWGEFLRGRTLAQLVEADGPMSAEECVVVGFAMCEALAAVHQAGVLHRDIKAQNVMRALGGRVVLTDFGIGVDTTSPSMAAMALAGTPLYLAPELFAGAQPSVQTDVYAVGVLLFYLATGTFPVPGETFDDIRHGHTAGQRMRLRDLRPELPMDFISAIETAISPDTKVRWQTAGDLAFALRPSRRAEPERIAESTGWKRWVVGAAIVTGLAAIWTGIGASRNVFSAPPFGNERVHFTISPPVGVVLTAGSRNVPTVSPDGRRVAFVGTDAHGIARVWIRDLSETTAQAVTGTEGAEKPVWAPDSASLLFLSNDRLMRIRAGETRATRIADMVTGGGASWAGNTVLFVPSPRSGVYQVPATGGEPRQVTSIDRERGEVQHLFPQLHANARYYLFYVSSPDASVRGIYLGDLRGARPRRLADSAASGTFAGDDVMFLRDGTLVVQSVDLAAATLTGQARIVAQDVGATWTAQGAFSASSNGVLAFASSQTRDTRKLVWADAHGRQISVIDEGERFRNPVLSPDNRFLAVERYLEASVELRIYDLIRGGWTRIGDVGDRSRDPVWSPDGRRLAYVSDRDGYETLLLADPLSRELPRQLWRSDSVKMPTSWSPDGRWIAVNERSDRNGFDIWLVATDGSARKTVLASSPVNEVNAKFSRDGRWVAYVSNQTGRYEVYVERFPGTGERRLVSINGGYDPQWGSGGQLFFLEPNGELLTATVPGEVRAPVAQPHRLFVTSIDTPGSSRNHFATTADGTRFLFSIPHVDRINDTIDVVINWPYTAPVRTHDRQ